ncbi:13458_t:CDS:2, partial [Acaulospora morrowiae]
LQLKYSSRSRENYPVGGLTHAVEEVILRTNSRSRGSYPVGGLTHAVEETILRTNSRSQGSYPVGGLTHAVEEAILYCLTSEKISRRAITEENLFHKDFLLMLLLDRRYSSTHSAVCKGLLLLLDK